MKKLLFVVFLLLSILSFGKGFQKGDYYTDANYIESIGTREPFYEKIEIFDNSVSDNFRIYLYNSGKNSFFSMPQAIIKCFDDNCDCEYKEVKLNVIYNDYYECYVLTGGKEDFINSLKKHNEVWIEVKYNDENGDFKIASGMFSCKNFTKMYDWLMNQ